MTLRELLTKVSDEKSNSFTEAKLISFVNEVEAEVAEQLGETDVPVYTDNHSDLDDVLLAPSPYDNLYVSYVKARIDFANEEYASYQLNQEQHYADFQSFVDWVVRESKAANPLPVRRFRNAF